MQSSLDTASLSGHVRTDKPLDALQLNDILKHITNNLQHIARGDFSHEYQPMSTHDATLGMVVNQIVHNLKAVVKHVNLVAQGRYDVDFKPGNENDELGLAISDMTEILREMSIENKKSAWIKSGQAELSNIIRGDQNSYELGKNVLSFLARYINALVGTMYQVSLVAEDTLEMIGAFAVSDHGDKRTSIAFGEGLIGQCAVEKEQLIFTDVPENYLRIESSIGHTRPRHLVITPFLIEEEIVGVMELGTVEAIDQTKLELLRQVSENVAIALKSSRNSERLRNLMALK